MKIFNSNSVNRNLNINTYMNTKFEALNVAETKVDAEQILGQIANRNY